MSKLKLFTLAAASMLAVAGSADNSWTAGQAVGGGAIITSTTLALKHSSTPVTLMQVGARTPT